MPCHSYSNGVGTDENGVCGGGLGGVGAGRGGVFKLIIQVMYGIYGRCTWPASLTD